MNDRRAILKQHIGYWLNRLRQCVHNSFEERLSKYGISIASWCVLLAVYDESANSINELAKFIEVDKASISRIVAKLVKAGYLVHGQGGDRRSGAISITEKGKDLMPRLIDEAESNEEEFFGSLNIQELTALQGAIRSILTQATKVNCEGWLLQDIKMENYMKKLQSLLKTSKLDQWPYPKTFEAMKEIGVTSYEVVVGEKYLATYLGEFGEFIEPAPEGFVPLAPAETFSKDTIREAIQKNIRKEATYTQFLQGIAGGGVTHYTVNMANRTVTYCGNDASEMYEEKVPEFKL